MSDLPVLKLKSREDRRLRQGHLWIYSNEVDTGTTPLKALEPGSEVIVQAANGRPFGRALVSPHSLICGRLFSRDPAQGLDQALMVARLEAALALRERFYPGTGCYRLFYGDADGLSGVAIDRYRDRVVCQIATVGMERRKDMLVDALNKVLAPRTIVFKHDAGARDAEGLAKYVEVVGETPDELVGLEENGVEFLAPITGGQKTGWFYDHRENRARVAALAAGQRVLDVFCYTGGWGLQALARGADSLLAVDGSVPALEVLERNAAHQGVADRVSIQRGDAFAVLEQLADAGERFGVVVIDPPALVKRKKDLRAGQHGYQRLARLGMRLTAQDGMLLFASCSQQYTPEMLRDTLRGAARHVERHAQLLGLWGHGPDHPVHPAISETDYLCAGLVRVRASGIGGAI